MSNPVYYPRVPGPSRLITLRPEPVSDADRLAAYEARREAPLGGLAHPHQVVMPHCWRPRLAKARRLPRAIAKGGGLWWRMRMEDIRARRAADPYKGLRRAAP